MLLPAASPSLPSYCRQQLLVEFAGLRYAKLDGLYVSITPNDPTLWVGVLFVRKGPYAHAVLRFQVSFPPSYPNLPPLVTFSTDVFHPLLTPLTTYTYTTGSSDTDTVSATDEERLPPGGFSLRHGFPHWFGRARRSAPTSRNVSGSGTGHTSQIASPLNAVQDPGDVQLAGKPQDISIVRILEYIRSTFNDSDVLDSLPLESAANPGAFHAWRAYRASTLSPQQPSDIAEEDALKSDKPPDNSTLGRNRRPGEWNWEGVWEDRVQKAVKASLSESVLYGAGAGDDIIRFHDGDEDKIEQMKKKLDVA